MRYQITSYELLKELLQSVPEADACMEWPRGRFDTGYGSIWHEGTDWGAHVLAYELSFGPIPDGQFVCHKCDNPPCFRPGHLFAATHGDNMRDCNRKGRRNWARGSRCSYAKLTEDQVREILALRLSGVKGRDLSRRFGVSESTVSEIFHRNAWHHI